MILARTLLAIFCKQDGLAGARAVRRSGHAAPCRLGVTRSMTRMLSSSGASVSRINRSIGMQRRQIVEDDLFCVSLLGIVRS